MLFQEAIDDLEGARDLTVIIHRILDSTPRTEAGIKILMTYIESEDQIVRYKVFKVADWARNKDLYDACTKYDLERFTKISIELKEFIEKNMVEFVKKHPIYMKDSFGMSHPCPFLNPAMDAIETAFWLGVDSADL